MMRFPVMNGHGQIAVTINGEALGDLAMEPNVDADDESKNKRKKRRDAIQNGVHEREGERRKKKKQKQNNRILRGIVLT